jgi:hypothetical protein
MKPNFIKVSPDCKAIQSVYHSGEEEKDGVTSDLGDQMLTTKFAWRGT